MKSSSLIGITFDLLVYHGSGTDGLFERCFDKACTFAGCDWDAELLKKRRRWALHFLRCNGYIEVIKSHSKWAVSPPTLVQTSDKTFLLIGSSKEREALKNKASRNAVTEIPSKFDDGRLPHQISFFPALLQLKASTSEAAQIAKEICVDVSFDYQQNLFKRLPSLDDVLKIMLIRVPAQPVFDLNTAVYFDLSKREWIPFSAMYPDAPGLYRSDPRYSRPSYYIARTMDKELEVFLIEDREWTMICLCALAGLRLPMKYKVSSEQLVVDANKFQELRLPTLIERCLRSGTLMEPAFSSTGMVYESIRYANLWQMVSRFPVFSLEQQS